jgi:hypothetical protein
MLKIERSVRDVEGLQPDALPEDLLTSTEPLVLKKLVADWPSVQAAQRSAGAAADYLRGFYQGATIGAFFGPPESGGRIFYNEDMSGFNYQPVMLKLDQVLDRLRQHEHDDHPPAIYVGSTTVDTCLPGFRQENDLGLGGLDPLVSIWLGNETRRKSSKTFTWGRWTSHRRASRSAWWTCMSLISKSFPALQRRCAALSSPNWNPATPFSYPACGGTMWRRWTVSTS